MTTSNTDRLSALLRRQRRSSATPEKVRTWSLAGLAASPLSHERHEELVEKLRSEAGSREAKSAPLDHVLTELGNASDMVAIVGWDIETDPGILLSGQALNRSEAFLRDAYPEGFVVCDQPLTRLLIVDFDDLGCAIEEVGLTLLK